MLRVVVWLLLLAAVLYVVFWVIDRRVNAGRGDDPEPRARRTRPPEGPRGPDDDEAFLRELDRRRRNGS